MRGKILAVLVVLMLISTIYSAPRMAVGEIFGRITCAYCRRAHEYLLTHRSEWEDSTVLIYMHTGSTDPLQVPGNAQRYSYYSSYYSMGYVPHMFVNGNDGSSGPYADWVRDFRATGTSDPTASFVGIDVVSHTVDSIKLAVYLDQPGHDGDYFIIAVLCRNELSAGGITWYWVAQKWLSSYGRGDMLHLTYGDTQYVQYCVTLDPGWDPSKTYFAAVVAGPTLPQVQNGIKVNMAERPPYAYHVLINRKKALKSPGDTANFTLTLTNDGRNDDIYHVSLVEISAPAAWDARLSGGMTSFDYTVSSASRCDVPIIVNAATRGVGKYMIVVSSHAISDRADTIYISVGAQPPVLLVNDSGEDVQAKYCQFFTMNGHQYMYWDTHEDGELGSFSTMGIDLVVWFCGYDSIEGIQGSESDEITNYINLGGKLLLNGAYIGRMKNSDFAFFKLGLGSKYDGPATSTTLQGSRDISQFRGYTGNISTAIRAEKISPDPMFAANTHTAMKYGDGSSAGIVREFPSSGGKLIFFGFPMEELPTLQFRDLMYRCLSFFGISGVAESKNALPSSVALSVAPTPFNEVCEIKYAVPDGKSGELSIVSLNGKTVKTVNVRGSGTYRWNAENLSSGVYVVKLITEKGSASRKILLVK